MTVYVCTFMSFDKRIDKKTFSTENLMFYLKMGVINVDNNDPKLMAK